MQPTEPVWASDCRWVSASEPGEGGECAVPPRQYRCTAPQVVLWLETAIAHRACGEDAQPNSLE